MKPKELYPFRLSNAFFGTLQFSRRSELPDPLEVQLKIEIKVHDNDFPKQLQLVLKVQTVEDQPLSFLLELIGLFDHVEELPAPDRSIIPDFINERALYMLWPYMAQVITNITGQMGTIPINVPTPYKFSFESQEEKPTKDE